MSNVSKLRVGGTEKDNQTTATAKCTDESQVGGTAPPFAVELGRRIASIRDQKSLRAFAGSLGISKNTLVRYEKGARLPDAWLIVQLREIYGVNPLWLLTGVGEPTGAPAPGLSHGHNVPPLIPELFTATMQAVDDELAARAMALESSEKADLVLMVYGLINTAVTEAEMESLTKLSADDVRPAVALVMNLRRARRPPYQTK